MKTIRVSILFATVLITASYGQAPAFARADYANDPYGPVCVDTLLQRCTQGGITWGGRTAEVSGVVWNTGNTNGYTTAYFDAFAGATKIKSETRTARDKDKGTPYTFTIGDPNLVGGINRIRIQVCTFHDAGKFCSSQANEIRD